MIFIAVGTQKFPLDRLLSKFDDLIEKKLITDEIFAQIGHCNYIPKYYQYQKFLNKEAFDKKIQNCDVLVTHSGVGTIISGLNNNKPIIVFPRLSKYGEHVDDHQLQIAESFSNLNYILLCNENDNLLELLNKSKSHKFNKYISQRNKVISTIQNYLDTL